MAQFADRHSAKRKPVLFSECPEILDCFVALRSGLRRLRAGRLESLEDDILGVFKLAAFKARLDERVDFRAGYLDRHGLSPLFIFLPPTHYHGTGRRSARPNSPFGIVLLMISPNMMTALIGAGAAIAGGLISGAYQHARDWYNQPKLKIDSEESAANKVDSEYTEPLMVRLCQKSTFAPEYKTPAVR